jgi:hypothetical protein
MRKPLFVPQPGSPGIMLNVILTEVRRADPDSYSYSSALRTVVLSYF